MTTVGMADAEIFAPRIEVTMDDGATWTVQTGNPDLVAWDMTAAKHKWPALKDAPFLWLTFLAWHGSRRRGLLPDPGMSWENFRAHAENIVGPDTDTPDADADDPEDETSGPGLTAYRPTRPGPGPG